MSSVQHFRLRLRYITKPHGRAQLCDVHWITNLIAEPLGRRHYISIPSDTLSMDTIPLNAF